MNLHQCVYSSGTYLYTNVLSTTPNTPFNTGTNVSDTRDTAAQCGSASSGWSLNTANVAVQSLDRVRGRYLNLHQCVYSSGTYLYTNVLSTTPNTPFNTGTNISHTPDSAVKCGAASAGWTLNSANTAVQSLDLAAGRYLNLHQCVYSSGSYLYTNVLSTTPNTPFNTGTNVSDTRDPVARCGPGSAGWTLNSANVAVQSLDLAPGAP
ncbi:hypothetical protein [Kutzneria kofuensis]|uniref:Uncharacterized protein n=1 Tax=Kutzneria kofuensis TaxID=103725 RepID=A0A7W9KBV1_9PSEU|nr:hypothetical protein [Kutzneria kofuensis]MBB5889754.1 hypothetical protein [Kutzneria kofuensis]